METIAALLAAGMSWTAAHAQQTQTAPAAPAAPAAAQASGPAWQLVCDPAPAATSAPAPAARPCSLVQNLLAGEQKQRLLTVILQRTPQAGHNLTIALPHGVLFPAGVSIQVDDAPAKALAVQTSDQNGAYTGTAVDATLLGAMRGGKALKIGFTAGNGQRIVVPVTLRDFATGLTALDKSPLPPAPRPASAPANPAPPPR